MVLETVLLEPNKNKDEDDMAIADGSEVKLSVVKSIREELNGLYPLSIDGVWPTERMVEEDIVEYLKAKGHRNVQRQYDYGIGFADIVSDDCIYEVKLELSHGSLCQAIGQVLLYRCWDSNPEKPVGVIYVKQVRNWPSYWSWHVCDKLGIRLYKWNSENKKLKRVRGGDEWSNDE